MKKTFVSFLMFIFIASISSQNIQFHYDFRHSLDKKNPIERNYLTTSFEMFHPDAYGNTFFVVDFDFKADKGNLGGVYTEISREFQIGDCRFLPHIEYNGGVGFDYVVPNAYLLGVAYPFSWKKFFFNTYLVYKYNNFEKASHDVQLTTSWDGKIFKDKISISGYIDYWTEDKQDGGANKKYILYGEPQFWYNFNKKCSVGTEIRISQNFEWFTSNFKAYPTLAIKYNFE